MKKLGKSIILGLACAFVCALATTAVACTGAGDFIEQMKCEHVWNGGKVTKKATCTEEGKKLYECTKCGKEKKEDLEKLPHTEHTVEMKAATCDQKGMTDYVECSVCNAILVAGKELPALGHTEIDLPGIEATCTTKGKTEGKYCTRCNEYTVEQTEIPALGHKIVAIEAVESTCAKQGNTAGAKCERCETVYTAPQVIPKKAHDFDEDGICQGCGNVTEAFFDCVNEMTKTNAGEVVQVGTFYTYEGFSNRIIQEEVTQYSCMEGENFKFVWEITADETKETILKIEGKAYVKDNNGEWIFVEGAFENFFVYKVDLENKVITVYVKTLEGTIVTNNKNYNVFKETLRMAEFNSAIGSSNKYV